MAKVNFEYNLKKDAASWVLIAKGKKKDFWGLNKREQTEHISSELLKKIQKLSRQKAEKLIADKIGSDNKKKLKDALIKEQIKALKKSWNLVEKKYFQRLSQVTQKPIFLNKFNCFITTGFMAPYNEKENWFMVSLWNSVPGSITTICHELLHLQFLKYYRPYLKKKGLKNEQIEILKEALTFLLNEKEFSDLLLCDDPGYPAHQKLRRKLHRLWQKEKDFPKFLDLVIKEIKK